MNLFPKVRPMRFWSQKVLPLVYDDSLSYYEVLSKVVHKINEIIMSMGQTFIGIYYDADEESIEFLAGGEDNE